MGSMNGGDSMMTTKQPTWYKSHTTPFEVFSIMLHVATFPCLPKKRRVLLLEETSLTPSSNTFSITNAVIIFTVKTSIGLYGVFARHQMMNQSKSPFRRELHLTGFRNRSFWTENGRRTYNLKKVGHLSVIMEDLSPLAADCVVICCCGPCLIMQITVLLFLRLPYKLARKSKELVLKKLHKREKVVEITRAGESWRQDYLEIEIECGGPFDSCRGHMCGVMDVDDVRFGLPECGYKCAILEADKVWEELSDIGEFGFGSFWRRKEQIQRWPHLV
ncbi:uncharacterized protein LOC131235114 [Magnolia sinica]|uniref:uncharacterized protein LOC131235114 n=1 Tax=Magnolia sinica TaxID=86752 RepID=UPI00265992FE|nr:uncharacterized protein LOC131235114 [Magnolia sinica]